MAISRHVCIIAILAIIIGLGVACSKRNSSILYYTCPMHAQIQMDKPGHCPICGMTLVPVRKGEVTTPAGTTNSPESHAGPEMQAGVYIPPDRGALVGVKTATVQKQDVTIEVRSTGQVANNSDLVIAQKEYLIARHLGDSSLASSVRHKLQLLGMSDMWIAAVEKRGQTDTELYQPVGGKRIFIEAAIFESATANIAIGQKVFVRFSHQGGNELEGTVIGINPTLNPTTRAATAFIEIPQKVDSLRAGMVVTVRFVVHLGEHLVVPESAVMDTGTRHIAVVVKDNYYDPREVEVGDHAQDLVIIKFGLEEGETVVTSANFLLDSEAQLKARLNTMTGHH